ncbi:MAG: 16S rRNA (cytosine(1402)-N(4))-methyltransferase RsmH [Actinomycetota bacterium]|nr:16S rRNA (cytosine(1402)-N(4))-methyltransferase RsmH [Actinomycetota bacterium]
MTLTAVSPAVSPAGTTTGTTTVALRHHRARPWRLCSLPVVGSELAAPSLSAARANASGPLDGGRATGGLQKHHDPAPDEFRHEPVLLGQVLSLLETVPDGVLVDATLGGGGHAAAALSARPGLELVGIDRDPAALVAARARLAAFGGRARTYHARFDALGDVLAADRARPGGPADPPPVVAVLFDLGVSSPQLDRPERGFSYRADGPLDMRMDPSAGPTASELLDRLDEAAFTALLVEHGEARFARRIARAVLAARPLGTTGALAEVVASAVPAAARRRGHPARRVFQALRVAVNDELGALTPALDAALEALAPGGRCVVLSYHSGEDRIVKERFRRAATGGCMCPPGLPCVCGAVPTVRLLHRGARKATEAEATEQPRARSARLRAVERLVEPGTRP